MKKTLFKDVEIPEGVDAKIEGSKILIKGPQGEISREFKTRDLEFRQEQNKILIGHKKATKNEKKMMNTITAHIKNMIQGVQTKFEYRLKICFNHFPFTVSVEGNNAVVKNFLGEKVPRKFSFPSGVEVKTDKEGVTISSVDKELAGLVAAAFEKSTAIKGRDRRIFQDGLFITKKAGKEI